MATKTFQSKMNDDITEIAPFQKEFELAKRDNNWRSLMTLQGEAYYYFFELYEDKENRIVLDGEELRWKVLEQKKQRVL